MTANTNIHTCSYHCERPECVKRQRDELRDRMESALAQQPAPDKFVASFRCESDGIVGSKDAPIHSVVVHDDGVIEVVIDYWPEQAAEIGRVRTDLIEADAAAERLRNPLNEIAAALKGPPPDGVWHSWHDLPEKAAQLAEEVRKLEERKQRDKALLRQVLEALTGQRDNPDWHTGKQREDAIAALCERLEERSMNDKQLGSR